MKRILLLAILACLLVSPTYALKIIVVRTMINGDGSGRYNNVSRKLSSGENAAGEQVNVISIGCNDPGDQACPRSLPVPVRDGGDPAYTFDRAIMSFIDRRMGEIDGELFENNNSAERTYIVCIQLSTGVLQSFRLYEKWSYEGKSATITLSLEDVNEDESFR